MRSEEGSLDWRSYVRPGDTVFDVGANMGNKAELYLNQGAKVVCVEPQPNCVAALKQRFKKNRRVTIIAKGLADKPGTLELSICSEAHTISTFAEQWKTGRFANYKWDKVIPVPITTLDKLIRKHGTPAYCKIDVEGFELSVLKGLSRPVPLLSFEYACEFLPNAGSCVSYLQQIGFEKFNFTRGEDPRFASDNWLGPDELFERIGRITDPELWGDIYACYGEAPHRKPPRAEPEVNSDASTVVAAGSVLRAGAGGGIREVVKRLFGRRRPAAGLPLEQIHNFNQNERDRWVASKAATVGSGQRVLDIGAGTCPYRKLFAHCNYRAHDFKKYEGVKLCNTREYGEIDCVSDVTGIPLPDASADVILCTEVLEHVPDPIAALREMSRLLRPGGRLFLTAPLGSGLHQLPYHFYGGYTPEWYKHFGPKFDLEVVEITPNGGFFKLLAQECARFSWTFDEHRHCHGRHAGKLRELFGELLPRYLYALDEKHCNTQFTVGYHVEMFKSGPGVTVPLARTGEAGRQTTGDPSKS